MKRKLISFTLSIIIIVECFLTGFAFVESNIITNVYASENVDMDIEADLEDEANEQSVNIADQDLSAVVPEFSDGENNSEEDHVHSYTYYVKSNDEHTGYCECGDEITEAHLFDGLVCSLCGYEKEESIDKSKVTSVIVATNAPSSYLFKKEINLWMSAYTVVSGDNQYSLILVSNQNTIDFTGEEFYGFFSDLKNCSQILFEEGDYYFDSNSFDFTGLGSNAGFPAELDFVDANIYLNTDSDYYAFSGANIKTVYLPAIFSSNGRVLLGESFAGYDKELKQIGEYSYIIPSYQEGSIVMLSNDPSYQVALLDNTDEVIWTDPDNGNKYYNTDAIEIVDLSNSGSNNIVCYGFDTDSNSIGDLYVVTSTNANNVLKCYPLPENSNLFCYPWSKKDSDTKSSNAKKIVFRDKLKTSPYFQHVFHYCVSLTDIIGFENIDTSNATEMTALFAGCSSLVNVDISSINTSKVVSFEYLFSGCTSLIELDVSNFDTSSAENMHNMFYKCNLLKTLDLSNFDTSKVTTMEGMFGHCYALTKLDLSNFNTGKVTTVQSMFYNCSKLTELNVSNFDTLNITTMYCMFYQCSSLINLDVSNFNTSNVTNMQSMFNGCSALTKLDLSSWNTNKVTTMYRMFRNCKSIINLDLSGFMTSNVTDMYQMFQNCSALKELNISNFDLSKVTRSDNFITGDASLIKIWIPTTFGICPKITLPNKMYAYDRNDNQYGINIYSALLGKDKISGISYLKKENILIWTDPDNGKEYWSDDALQIDNQLDVNKSGTILGYQFDSDADNTADLYVVLSESPNEVLGSSLYSSLTGDSEFFKTKAKDMTRVVFKNALKSSGVCSYFYDFTKLKSIIGLENLNTENATTMQYMFHNCYKLTDLNLSQLNTKNVTDMSMMFNYCKSLTELDISHFNTSNVTDMHYMFQNCESLLKLNISNIDTSNVTNMYSMFSGCSSLKILDLKNFNTSKVKSMYGMFRDCKDLIELDVSSFDTSNVTTMESMFNRCSSLTKLDLPNFTVNNVTSMYMMFSGCSSLIKIDLSSFNVSKVNDISYMFDNCDNLQILYINNLDTSNVTKMHYMFANCYSLQSLDLSRFNTSNVQDMKYMFNNCRSLLSLNISNFNTSNVTNMGYMFYNCKNLKELDLSHFNMEKVTDTHYILAYCNKLINLDISGWDLTNVTYGDDMFSYCPSLKNMNMSGAKLVYNGTYSAYPFKDDTSLEHIDLPDSVIGSYALPVDFYGYKTDGSIIDRDFIYTTLPSKDETTGLSFISNKLLLYNSFIIAVPANINMDLCVDEGTPYYQGNGNINIEYNMLQNKNISISPAKSFSLKNDDQSRSLTASVILDKKITNFNNNTEGSVKKTSDIDKNIFGDLSETYTNTMPFTIVAPANKVADNYTGSLGFTIATVPAS